MKTYVILDGGGVKGAALAGCLKATEELGIEVLGYGGTSAGSIVALLASVGYSASEIERIMVHEVNFNDFLDDNGKDLLRLKAVADRLHKPRNWLRLATALWQSRDLIARITSEYGLYHGDNLQAFLLDKIKTKLPQFRLEQTVTFDQLETAGCKPLKVVASDVRTSSSIVFSNKGGKDSNGSVIDAVRASLSYPFVFKPVQQNSRYLVDGGLSSNLPVFLFEEERRKLHYSVPLIAFDLVAPSGGLNSAYSLGKYCSDMLSTALESGDRLLRESSQGTYYVPIETPSGVGTLDFDLSAERRQELFTKGHSQTHSYFRSTNPHWTEARNRVEQIQALRGDPGLINFLLSVMVSDFERHTSATKLRANIMLPAGNDTRVVVYQYEWKMIRTLIWNWQWTVGVPEVHGLTENRQ